MYIIPKVSQRRARMAHESTIDLDPLVAEEHDRAHSSTISLPAISPNRTESESHTQASSQRSRVHKFFHAKSWRFGLHAGLYASTIVLFSNIALLLTGIITHDDTYKGISTITKGETHRITAMSTVYHVLINVLSTVLLTSSNYAMQIICAPTRTEVDKAHARGQWLDIGIMSVHNLRHISRKRLITWVLLAFSSAPLHLL
jgi:hypothetical protein